MLGPPNAPSSQPPSPPSPGWPSKILERSCRLSSTLPGSFSLPARSWAFFSQHALSIILLCGIRSWTNALVSLFQLTWLNSHLTKIWPYVNEVAPGLCFRCCFRGGCSFLFCYFVHASVLLGCFWAHKDVGGTHSWTI